MKIRSGFVSNSSSSSYLILGVDYDELIEQLVAAEGYDAKWFDWNGDQGMAWGKVLRYVGYYGENLPTLAGVDPEVWLETMTLPQARQHFVDLVEKELSVVVSIDDVNLYYGETSNS